MKNPKYTTLVKGMEAKLAFLVECKETLLKASNKHKNSKHYKLFYPDRPQRLRKLTQEINKVKIMMSELDFIRTAWLPRARK